MNKVSSVIEGQLYSDILEITEDSIDWSGLNNKTVLITGAAGFIAYHLVAAMLLRNDLKDAGIKVIGMVRKPCDTVTIRQTFFNFYRFSKENGVIIKPPDSY